MATIKQIKDSAGTTHDIVDTKNTAGSTNSSSKLYLIGAASQASNPQTYSNSNCYTSDGRLYSSGITSTDNLVLSNNSTETPKIIFQRKTSTDEFYDYQLSGETGGFKFSYSSTSGQGIVTNIATIDSNGNYSGNAATATMASKLGSSTIGASNRPIYLNAGTPTACNVGEAFLDWGGKDFSGSYGPIDAAMIPNLGANRLAFAKPAGIYIEYSRDGGVTWIDYEASDSQKICLTTTTSAAFTLGKNTVKGDSTSDYMLRITFESGPCNIYTEIKKFAIYVSTNGSSLSDASNNMRCILQIAKNGSENTFTDIKTVNLSGWSGWNIINTSLTMSGNASHTTYANKVRFIFSHDSCNASYLGGSVYRIFGYGGVGWTTPSTLASSGDLYSYDTNQNMIIPTGLYSSSTTGTSDLGRPSKYWKDGYINNLYIGGSAGNTRSKITSDTTTNMYISVNGTIPFVIDASNTTNPIIRASTSLPRKVSLGTSTVPFKDVYADNFNGYTIEKSVPSDAVFTDTKNTAGSTNSSSKLFLIGATSQAANPQTYSHDTAYVGTDGCLYSNSNKVITVSDMATTTTDGIMSSEDKTKLDRVIDYITFEVDMSEFTTDSSHTTAVNGLLQSNTVPTLKVGDIVKIISNIEFPTTNSIPRQVTVHFDIIDLIIINSSGVSRKCGTLKFDYENDHGNAEVSGRWVDRALRKYGGYFYVKITKINSTSSSSEPEYLCTILYNNFSGLVSPYSEKTGLLLYDRNIDGINFNGSSNIKHYGTCTTSSGTIAKTATISNFTLDTGSMVVIDFTTDNTAGSPTLNISSTGAKSLFLGSSTSVGTFNAGLYLIVYDGSYYRMINSVNATKLSFKPASNNASYIVPFLDKSDYSSGTNSVYVGQNTTYPFSFNPSTGILTVKQTSSSDERLKDFVKDLNINFGDLKRIPKKYFTWKCDEEKHLHIGTSAQELEKIYPELVSEYGDEKEGLYKAVDYSTLSIIALAAIDKLNERIEYLENKLKELE